jgi:hypothetical protein
MRAAAFSMLLVVGCARAGSDVEDASALTAAPDAPVAATDAPIVVDGPALDAAATPPDSAPPDSAPTLDASIPNGCASGVTTQNFDPVMAGCAGSVMWADRGTLCGAGRVSCAAAWWTSLRNGAVPTHNYWTADDLAWSGSGTNACAAVTTGGTACSPGDPMRVCGSASDPEGNACNWTGCGFGATTPNQYFGGCVNNHTAGALCCVAPCSDGTVEDVFPGGMFGCGGRVTFAARASLCGAGYHVCNAAEWVAKNGAKVPAHDYWTNDDLRWTGSGSGMCAVSTTAGTSCTGASPMRVCVGATDPEGNTCSWIDCGYGTQTPDQHFGGCAGDVNAGALCCAP